MRQREGLGVLRARTEETWRVGGRAHKGVVKACTPDMAQHITLYFIFFASLHFTLLHFSLYFSFTST